MTFFDSVSAQFSLTVQSEDESARGISFINSNARRYELGTSNDMHLSDEDTHFFFRVSLRLGCFRIGTRLFHRNKTQSLSCDSSNLTCFPHQHRHNYAQSLHFNRYNATQ